MKPNHGVEVAGLRVLLTSHLSGTTPWYWSLAALFELDVESTAWDITVMSTSSSSVLARRRFGRRRDATLAREEFVRAAAAGLIDSSSPPQVQAGLDAVRTPA